MYHLMEKELWKKYVDGSETLAGDATEAVHTKFCQESQKTVSWLYVYLVGAMTRLQWQSVQLNIQIILILIMPLLFCADLQWEMAKYIILVIRLLTIYCMLFFYSTGTGSGSFVFGVPVTSPPKFFESGKEKKFIGLAGFEPMTTAPPTPALVTQHAAAGCRFWPILYTLPL